ncbi:uncharacterized protein J8A68_004542 [[Candida] subhashii]|uniref:Aminotransferase class V domain-containing protein n=1 Tax=[Candida] subhashii TaxID=561895 RepID=A0A8J5UWV7_9ASCO|nr:uncharacterized protein J8A68_004542 [[Candida] subhashii]KAG7661939.1 hypothetical protein J8A68_004542 [[Candida] subhashii]
MTGPVIPFGKEFREKYFTLLDPKVYPVNHGSFGLVPTPVYEKYIGAIAGHYTYPDKFYLHQRETYIKPLKEFSRIVNCDYRNLAFVDNVTTGINTVLRSYPFKKGDKTVIQSTVYGACGNTVKFLQDRYGIECIEVPLNYPISDKEILDKF